MPKLISVLAEGLAIRGLLVKDKAIRGHLFSSLSVQHFRTEQAREAFTYILNAYTKSGLVPTYRLMLEASRLTQDTKDFLKDCTRIPASLDQAKQIVTTLNDYRKAYLFYSLSKDILTEVEQKKMDLDKLTELAINKLTEIQTGRDIGDTTFHFGLDGNADEIVHNILYVENNDQFIPTGYKPWDDINGGWIRGQLVMLAGSTGAGKSHNAVQIGVNMARAGYKVTLVPLEMSGDAITCRVLANIAGIDSLKILLQKLATDEKALIEDKFKKFNARCARKGGRLTIHKPGSDMALGPLFASMHSFNSDVYLIDYVGLLGGADGDDQWRKLGAIAREAAVYADIHKKVVGLFAQVSDEGKLKYSQTMREHAATMWSFVANKESREQGFLKYNVDKARLQDSRSFVMGIDYSLSRIYYNGDTSEPETSTGNGPSSANKNKKTKDDMMPDLTD